MRHLLLVFTLMTGMAAGAAELPEEVLYRAPSGSRYVEINPGGETVLPNGRLLTPSGDLYRVRPHPYGLTMSADGRWVVAVSSEGPQLSVLDLRDPANPVRSYIPDDMASGEGVLDAAFMGLAVAPDNRTLYVSGGRDFAIHVFDLETRAKRERIDCAHAAEGVRYEHGYTGDLRLSPDGARAYVLDQSNFRLITVELGEAPVVRSVAVGRYPFGLALSPDGKRAYVANVGMFEYEYVTDAEGNVAMLSFPAAGLPSREAVEGLEVDGLTVPGLGDVNDVRGMSVWTVDVTDPGAARVVAKTKTGHLVGEELEDFPAVGGSSPNSVVVVGRKVYVSNGSNDSITVVDATTQAREADIDLALSEETAHLRGIIPFGLAASADGTTLYVAEAGLNAVAAIDLETRTVLGHVPTAWFPSKLALSPDGKTLYAACAKGLGSGPNDGPNHRPGDPTGIGDLMRGYINAVPLPETAEEWAAATARVVRNTVARLPLRVDTRPVGHPVPVKAGRWESPIRHVVYVTKENRTYDEVFGAFPGGRGDAELCRLGRPIEVSNQDGSRVVEDVVLMPNHLALAERFAISDNFYCDSDHSVDGHKWLVGTYPNEFVEAKIGQSALGDGPGNHMFTGATGAIYPEDYNEAGSIWEHFARGGLRFSNFGLGFELHPAEEEQEYRYTGVRFNLNYPIPKALFENTSRMYATYNTNIPDQFRMDMFAQEFETRWASGLEPFPQVITIMLPNDHGASERPEDGYPFWGSYMSDNDLALGRLVELLSHSPWWKHMAIFVTEDDAQGYRDTVDAHRSILMVISPYSKRRHVSHVHANFGSILKTIFRIHGLPPLNQYDAFANDLADCFATAPDNSAPYNALPVDKRVFDPQAAFDPFDAEFKWEAKNDFEPLDNQPFLDADPYGHSGPAAHGPR